MPCASRGDGRSAARGGFSLLELLVVLALLAIVSTVAVRAFFARGEVTLENAARRLVDDLHLAQSRALYLHVPVTLAFDADGFGYRVTDPSGKPSGLPELDGLGRRYDGDAVFEGVHVFDIGPGGREVVFDAKGSVAKAAWITLEYRGETRTVRVDAAAGVCLVVDSTR